MALRSRISKEVEDHKLNFFQLDDAKIKKKFNQNAPEISWQWALFTIALGCLMYYFVHYNDYILPKPISAEEIIENSKVFSGENSRRYLKKFTSLGPRTVGDDINEIVVPYMIINETKRIIRYANPIHSFKIETQRGSGAYTLAYKNKPIFTNVYDNIMNVIIMLEGSVGNHSVLLNCHYDSVPEVEGASDDALSCAVMLELLRAISNDEIRPKHNIVFLFNGAEEVGLQASHLFLQHEWSNKTRIFINLESAGSGGREMLFQTGPKASWIFKYYSKYAPHPHSQVFAEEIFQSGFIPSDTDFRIFRDFKNLRGLDFAIGRNGYLYHTKYDKEIYIPMGTHQHMGDNVLAILRPLARSSELEDMKSNSGGQMVFYDYLGWFMISYSTDVGVLLNSIAIILALTSIIVFTWRLSNFNNGDEKYFYLSKNLSKGIVMYEILIAFFARIFGIVVAFSFVSLVAYFINSTANLAMPWFTNVWLIFPLYWCPCLVISTLIPHLIGLWRLKKQRTSESVVAQINIIASQCIPILLIFILTCLQYRSSSVLLIPVFSSAIVNLIIHVTPLYLSAYKWIWTYLLLHTFSLIWALYFTLLVYILFIPVMGRSGVINGDLYIGIVSVILCLFSTNFVFSFIFLVRRSYIIYVLLAVFSGIMITLSLTTDIGFPYKGGPNNPTPQRYWIMHSLREFRNDSNDIRRTETGYFVLNLDINSPRTIPEYAKSNMISLENDCNEEQYCGLPLYLTRMVTLSARSSWIPGPAPYLPMKTELVLKKKDCQIKKNECSFTFILKGPDRMTLTFSPRTDVNLISWSIPTEPLVSGEWRGNSQYFIHIVRGRSPNEYEITLNFKIKNKLLNDTPVVDISLAGNHVHHQKYRTQEFQSFLSSLPDFIDKFGWISSYRSYVF